MITTRAYHDAFQLGNRRCLFEPRKKAVTTLYWTKSGWVFQHVKISGHHAKLFTKRKHLLLRSRGFPFRVLGVSRTKSSEAGRWWVVADVSASG